MACSVYSVSAQPPAPVKKLAPAVPATKSPTWQRARVSDAVQPPDRQHRGPAEVAPGARMGQRCRPGSAEASSQARYYDQVVPINMVFSRAICASVFVLLASGLAGCSSGGGSGGNSLDS